MQHGLFASAKKALDRWVATFEAYPSAVENDKNLVQNALLLLLRSNRPAGASLTSGIEPAMASLHHYEAFEGVALGDLVRPLRVLLLAQHWYGVDHFLAKYPATDDFDEQLLLADALLETAQNSCSVH